jgi:hypothetical protein
MAKQVGPARGKPTTSLAFEAGFNDWLPCARIPSWPRVAKSDPHKEAADTFAVRPLRHPFLEAAKSLRRSIN